MSDPYNYTNIMSRVDLVPLKGYVGFLRDKKSNIVIQFDYTDISSKYAAINEPDYYGILVSHNSDFVGYIESYRPLKFGHVRYNNYLFLSDLIVHRDHSRKGVASSLIKMIKDHALEKGFDGIMTQTEKNNIPALALYKKSGFVQCGTNGLTPYPYKELKGVALEYHI